MTARQVSALARSCHPGPVVAVTVFSGVLAGAAGRGWPYVVLVPLAVLAGQLSIGWSNDRIDTRRDRAVGRRDKPLADGQLAPRVVDGAIGVSLAATVAFSLALGLAAGLTHLAAVACGWLYNLGLKATWWSWLPYAAAFGALPAVATLAGPHGAAPAAWAWVAGAALGVAANLTNALPDLDADRETGVRGFPHRIGARPSLAVATALVLGASAAVTLGPPLRPDALRYGALASAAVLALAGLARGWRRPGAAAAFQGLILVVALDVVAIAVSGSALA